MGEFGKFVGEGLGWGFPSEGFAGPVVPEPCDVAQVALGVWAEV
jgi:hypothetical protein